jgi:hypothetical protein
LATSPAIRPTLGQMPDLAEQHLVPAEAKDVADAVALQPSHGLGPTIVAVAAHQDVDRRPTAADRAHDMTQDERHLGTARCLARPQDHRHRLAARGLVDMDRQEAVPVMVGVEQRQLLLAVHPVLGVVDVEHDPPGHLLEAVAEQLDHGRHHALQRRRPGQVLQPAHGRLRAQIRPGLRQPTDRQLERRVGAQELAVVAVRIAGRDHQRAKADHLGQAVAHPLGRSWVLDAACQAPGEPEPPLDLRQQQHAGVRGQPAAVEPDVHGLAANR